MRGQRQSQLRQHRHHQHDNHNRRHLAEQAKRRWNGPFRHVAARQHHVFGNGATVAVGHRHALNHKQTGERRQHVRNAQDDNQKGVKQPDQRTEREGDQDRLGRPKAMPDEQRNHQRICQRRRRTDGEIKPADGQGNRHPNRNHRHDGDGTQNVDDVERIEEVVRRDTKNRHQRDHGQQHAPFVEKIEKLLTARRRRIH
ncbi:hypothetical protein D3C71_1321590 [compost metagenome]